LTVDRIWTIGHSNQEFEPFVAELAAQGIVQLADIRAFPASRRHPHFARAALEHALPAHGIAYRWLPGLGGHRRPVAGSSANAAWENDAFRGYADHLATPEFAAARDALEAWARVQPTAYMCAEAKFWQCHRNVLSDALVARGWEVLHILGNRVRSHVLTPFAVATAAEVTYPGPPQLPLAPS
jgi:uncharacterized protein (DUF488 family)